MAKAACVFLTYTKKIHRRCKHFLLTLTLSLKLVFSDLLFFSQQFLLGARFFLRKKS